MKPILIILLTITSIIAAAINANWLALIWITITWFTIIISMKAVMGIKQEIEETVERIQKEINEKIKEENNKKINKINKSTKK